MTAPLNASATTSYQNMAIQCQQLMDNSGNAADVADLIGTGGGQFIAAGSTLTLTQAKHRGKTIMLDTLTGSVVTLPAATGSGAVYEFIVKVVNTSNTHEISCASGDKMQGLIFTEDSATVTGYVATAGTSVNVSLNGTTTGGLTIGNWVTVQDVATNRYQVTGMTSSSGTAATPFS